MKGLSIKAKQYGRIQRLVKTYMWHSLFMKSKHRSTTGFGSLKVLQTPRSKSKFISLWRSSLHPTILLAFKKSSINYRQVTKVNLSFVGGTSTEVPKFILKSHSTPIMSLCTVAVLENQVFVYIS